MAADDAFLDIIDLLKQPDGIQGVSLALGTVISNNPLKVKLYGLVISGKSLMVNDELKTRPLKPGERVLTVSEDMQVFYILCRVVAA